MLKEHIKDKNISNTQLAKRLYDLRLEIDWIEDELLMRELQFRSDHALWHYETEGNR